MFISEAIAATEPTAAVEASPMTGFIIQLVLVFAIFYFLLIRPQQKKMKEHENTLNAIKPGDEVVTGGGIYGRVVKADDAVLTIEIAKGTEIRVSRATIRDVVSDKIENTEKK